MDNLGFALDYARQGRRVFQVHSITEDLSCTCGNPVPHDDGKHPLTATAPSGLLSATIDEYLIKEWWERYPWANVGVATGPLSNLLVIDVDPRNGGDQTLIDLMLEHGEFPNTPNVITGSQGLHVYFQYPTTGKAISRSGALGPGIDSKGYGGYVVAPPSRHKSGRQYAWDLTCGMDTPLAIAPDWVLDKLQAPDTTQPLDTAGDAIPDGKRHSTMVALAGGMRRNGMTPDEIFASISLTNQRRCRPPLPESEVRKICGSMKNYTPNPSPIRVATSPLPLPQITSARMELVELNDLLDEPPVEQPYLVDNLLLLGGTSLWVAKPGVGKSSTIRGLARVVCGSSDKWLSRGTANGRVLYYAMEENRDQVRRHFDAMGSRDLPYEMFLQIGAVSEDGLQQVWDAICEKQPTLVVIDPVIALAQIDEPNNYSQVRRWMERIAEMARRSGCHIACIHHSNKSLGRDDIDSAVGSIAMPGTVDTMIVMRRTRDKLVLINSAKVRYGEPLPETVLLMNERREIVDGGTYEEQTLNVVCEAVLQVIGIEELTEPEVDERLTSANRSEVSKALRSLVQNQKLVRSGAGRRNSPYRYGIPTDLSDFPEFEMPSLWTVGQPLPDEGFAL